MVQAYRVREGLLEEVALKDVLELPVGTNLPRLPRTEGVLGCGTFSFRTRTVGHCVHLSRRLSRSME